MKTLCILLIVLFVGVAAVYADPPPEATPTVQPGCEDPLPACDPYPGLPPVPTALKLTNLGANSGAGFPLAACLLLVIGLTVLLWRRTR